jgi:hypothetical protein
MFSLTRDARSIFAHLRESVTANDYSYQIQNRPRGCGGSKRSPRAQSQIVMSVEDPRDRGGCVVRGVHPVVRIHGTGGQTIPYLGSSIAVCRHILNSRIVCRNLK